MIHWLLKKKCSDFGSIDKKDDCNIRNDIGSEKHYPERNHNDQVVRTVGTKEQSDSSEKEVHEKDIRDVIIESLDKEVTDAANQFPKLKVDNGELSKTEM